MMAPAGDVERAIAQDDYPAARKAMAIRLARMFDSTDSAREVKALTISLAPLVERCERDYADTAAEEDSTPLDRIMKMAESA